MMVRLPGTGCTPARVCCERERIWRAFGGANGSAVDGH
jgi:hypothetical protein